MPIRFKFEHRPPSSPLTEEVRKQFDTEDRVKLVFLIRTHLINPTDLQWTLDEDISIKEILEHKYTQQEANRVQRMFDDWNQKLGVKKFSCCSTS